MLFFLLLGLSWILPNAGLVFASSKIPVAAPRFSLDSESPRPSFYFTSDVLCGLKSWLQSKQEICDDELALSTMVCTLLHIHETEIDSKGCSVIRNYHSTHEEPIPIVVDKVIYYLVQITARFVRLDCSGDSMYDFVVDLIEGLGSCRTYLLRTLYKHSIPFLGYVLHHFVRDNNLPIVKEILDACPLLVNTPVSLPCSNENSFIRLTPLAVAAGEGNIDLVEELLARGADVNARVTLDCHYGQVPVLFAAFTNLPDSVSIVELILDHPEFNKELCTYAHGPTPLFYVIENDLNVNLLEPLMRVFDMNCSIDPSNSLLDAYGYAICMGMPFHAMELTFSPDFCCTKQNESGDTYLILAAWHNNAEAVSDILKQYDDPRYYQLRPGHVTFSNMTAIRAAIEERSLAALEVLIQYASEFEINAQDWTNPLYCAISYQDFESVQIILGHPKVSLDCKVMQGNRKTIITIWEKALEMGNDEIIDIMRDFLHDQEFTDYNSDLSGS